MPAVYDTQTGKLTILAEPGFAFDFTGSLQAAPDLAGFTGTAVPQISGEYTGAANDQFQLRVVGSGTVGVTPGLSLEVRDSAGQLVTTLDIGQSYEPGSLLAIRDGVQVRLSSGTVNDGDTFVSDLVAQPDTSGLLVALGLNSLFAGSTATDIELNASIAANSQFFSTGITSAASDTVNLNKLIALRDTPLADGRTLEQTYVQLVAGVGVDLQHFSALESHLGLLQEQLDAERAGISGVDPNEEMVQLLQFQRSFQAASRYIATLDETLDDLFRIVG